MDSIVCKTNDVRSDVELNYIRYKIIYYVAISFLQKKYQVIWERSRFYIYSYIYIYITTKADDATKAETAAVRRLSIMLSVLGLGAVQIELSIWQHRIALQLCVAHCLRSLSSLRYDVEKSLRTTNETIFLAHINLSVGSA